MRHKSPGQFDGVALNRHPRSWQDEPPIKNPERLRYLLTLLAARAFGDQTRRVSGSKT